MKEIAARFERNPAKRGVAYVVDALLIVLSVLCSVGLSHERGSYDFNFFGIGPVLITFFLASQYHKTNLFYLQCLVFCAMFAVAHGYSMKILDWCLLLGLLVVTGLMRRTLLKKRAS